MNILEKNIGEIAKEHNYKQFTCKKNTWSLNNIVEVAKITTLIFSNPKDEHPQALGYTYFDNFLRFDKIKGAGTYTWLFIEELKEDLTILRYDDKTKQVLENNFIKLYDILAPEEKRELKRSKSFVNYIISYAIVKQVAKRLDIDEQNLFNPDFSIDINILDVVQKNYVINQNLTNAIDNLPYKLRYKCKEYLNTAQFLPKNLIEEIEEIFNIKNEFSTTLIPKEKFYIPVKICKMCNKEYKDYYTNNELCYDCRKKLKAQVSVRKCSICGKELINEPSYWKMCSECYFKNIINKNQ